MSEFTFPTGSCPFVYKWCTNKTNTTKSQEPLWIVDLHMDSCDFGHLKVIIRIVLFSLMFECVVLISYFLKSFYVCRMLPSNSRKRNLHLLILPKLSKKNKPYYHLPVLRANYVTIKGQLVFHSSARLFFNFILLKCLSISCVSEANIYIFIPKTFRLSHNSFSRFTSAHNIVQFSTHIIDCTYWQFELFINFVNFVNCYVLIISLFPD